MGSISSAPRAPAQPQIVYVPAPAPSTTTTSPNTSSQTDDETNTPSDEEVAAEVRQQNLLQRSRGRLGTILTGFRGIFTSPSENSSRKTLLGE